MIWRDASDSIDLAVLLIIKFNEANMTKTSPNDVDAKAQPDTHMPETQELTLSSQVKHFTNTDRTPVLQKWKRIYDDFLGCRNTSKMIKKRQYLEKILGEFSDCIPLASIVDGPIRKELSKNLFGKTNDFNYVIYPLGMGLWMEALRLDGEHIVVNKRELL